MEIGWPQSTYGRLGYYGALLHAPNTRRLSSYGADLRGLIGICVVKPFGRPARPACVPWTDGWSGREIAHRLSLHNRLNFNGTEYYDRFGSHIDLAARLQRDTFFPSLLIAGCLVFVLAFFLTTTSIYSRSLQPTVRKITAVIAKISALAAALLFLLTASFSQAVVIGESSILGTTTFVQPGLALLVMQWITAILAGFFAGLVPAAIESGIKETREGFFHLHIEDTNCQDDMS